MIGSHESVSPGTNESSGVTKAMLFNQSFEKNLKFEIEGFVVFICNFHVIESIQANKRLKSRKTFFFQRRTW